MNIPGPGAFRIPSSIFSVDSLKDVAETLSEPPAKVNHVCNAETVREEAEVLLPATVRIDKLPKNVEFANRIASYQANYSRDGQTIKVVRTLVKRFPRGFCTPEESVVFREVAEVVKKDIGAQVLYQ